METTVSVVVTTGKEKGGGGGAGALEQFQITLFSDQFQ